MTRYLPEGPPFHVDTLAGVLGVSTWSVRRALPKIGYTKFGGVILIPRENVEAYLSAQGTPPPKPMAAPRPRREREGGKLTGLVNSAISRARRRATMMKGD